MNIILFGILFCAIAYQVQSAEIEDFRPFLVDRPIIRNQPVPVERQRKCTVAYRCSDSENVQWATDGFNCYVFRNECFLASANCDRRNQNLKVLANVDKSECQKLCRDMCQRIYRPVCAIYNGQPRTFSNSCNMINYICQTGKTYNLYSSGECPQQSTTQIF